LRLQCGMPCSKLEVSTVQHGTLSGAGYLHQSRENHLAAFELTAAGKDEAPIARAAPLKSAAICQRHLALWA